MNIVNIVLLALIAVVLLGGLIATAAGHRGWSWGTVTGAILLLLSVTGYLYLAARLAEREQAWRTKVAKNEAEIGRIVSGSGPAAGDSLAALRAQRDRWRRVETFVNTWRGRFWKGPQFSPPRQGQPGTLDVEMPSEESAAAPINVGADLAVFDGVNVEEGGRFLGIFRVSAPPQANKGDATCRLSVVPADAPNPPSEADTALWSRDYENVTVYENLPTDRWMAFQTLVDYAKAGDEAATDGDAAEDRWLPRSSKTPDDRLGRLEEAMQLPKHHDELIPEEDWARAGEEFAKGDIPQGSLWAVVEFEQDVTQGENGKLVLDVGSAGMETATPAEADAEEDEGPAGAPGEMAAPGEMITPKENVRPPAKFAKGSQAEFDYQTALALQDDDHWARIKKLIYRRPLVDPFTALRGSDQSEGIYRIKQALLTETDAIARNTRRIEDSRRNVDLQATRTAEESQQLDEDLDSWRLDVAAAEKASAAFDRRLRAATLQLTALEDEIVDLGRELRGMIAALTQTIDASAPAPVRQR